MQAILKVQTKLAFHLWENFAKLQEGFYWMPLRAEIADQLIEITFSSSVLPAMMEDAGILLVFSEPIDE